MINPLPTSSNKKNESSVSAVYDATGKLKSHGSFLLASQKESSAQSTAQNFAFSSTAKK